MAGRLRDGRRAARGGLYGLYCLGAAGTLLVLVELVLRALPYQPPSSRILAEFVNPEWSDQYTYRLCPELFWEFRPGQWIRGIDGDGEPYQIRINNLGFRGPDFPDPGAEDAYRIMLVGDSCAFGLFVEEGDDLGGGLVRLLSEAFPGRRFHAFNAGSPGYSSLQARFVLEKYGPLYRPHLVVPFVGSNDVLPQVRHSDWEIHRHYRRELRRSRILEASKLFTTARGGLARLAADEAPSISPRHGLTRVTLEESEANFRALLDYARDRLGASTLLITRQTLHEGHPIESLNAMLKRLAEETGTPLADAHAAFREHPDPAALYAYPDRDIVHPNATGYRMIAQRAVEVMLAHGLPAEPTREAGDAEMSQLRSPR